MLPAVGLAVFPQPASETATSAHADRELRAGHAREGRGRRSAPIAAPYPRLIVL